MNWYQGGIGEAVRISKQKGAIFVVYVEGNDDKSDELTRLINDEQVTRQLESEHFVAIKIVDNSVPLEQFRQIYKQVDVPSLFFIGQNGAPLEIIKASVGVTDFLDKVKQILLKHGVVVSSKEDVGNTSVAFNQKEQEDNSKNYDVVCENDVCTIRPKDQPSSSKEADVTNSDKSEEKPATPDEKLERAKELLNKTREAKQLLEEENARKKEIERRKTGQDVQKLKRWQNENDLKELVEERNKEKKEQEAARQRVLQQIAQDKAERAAKFATSTPVTATPGTSTVTARAPVDSDTARLQFRLPDGTSYTHEFLSSNTLEDIYNYILKNIKVPFQSYTLSTTFPRREYTAEESSKTLMELGLTPTAVILILPLHGVVQAHTNSWLLTFIWSFIGPFLNFIGYLKNKISGGGSTSTGPSSIRDRKRTPNAAEPTSSIPTKKRMPESSTIRRQGSNIHRLADKSDSEDENNTWNGNSTQQM